MQPYIIHTPHTPAQPQPHSHTTMSHPATPYNAPTTPAMSYQCALVLRNTSVSRAFTHEGEPIDGLLDGHVDGCVGELPAHARGLVGVSGVLHSSQCCHQPAVEAAKM